MARRDAALKLLKSQPLLTLSKRLNSEELVRSFGKGSQPPPSAPKPFSGGCNLASSGPIAALDDRLSVRSSNAISRNAISGNGISVRTIPSCFSVSRLASSVVVAENERDSDDQGTTLASSIHAPSIQSTHRPRHNLQQTPKFSSPKLLIGRVCQVLRDTEWGHGTEESLQSLGIYFTPHLVNEVLRCQQDVDKAMGFFEHVRKQPYYKHNSRTLAKMLTLLGAAKRYDEVERLVESLRKERTVLDTQLFNTLIHIYGGGNMIEKALRILDEFRKDGGRPTAYTYSSMIQVFMKLGDVQNGMAMYRQMLQAKFVPDHTTFNIVIDSLAKADQVGAGVFSFHFELFPCAFLLHFHICH